MSDPHRDIDRLAEIQQAGPLSDEQYDQIIERERKMTKVEEGDIWNTLALDYRGLRDVRAQNALDGLLRPGHERLRRAIVGTP
jgi:hypothetical protein